jgi:hypothetical protein
VTTDWAAAAAGAAPPSPPPDALDRLAGMLADPDPAVRDGVAYTVLAGWLAAGVFDDGLAEVGDRMTALLRDPRIQARAFAPLVLASVVRRDTVTRRLPDGAVPRWRDAFAAWWPAETELAGWDEGRGWLHAVAHGADLLRALARSPRLGAPDLVGLLRLGVERLLAPTGYLFAHGEDERLGCALAAVLTRPELTPGEAVGWLDPVAAALAAGEPGPVPPFAANTIRTVRAAYVYADRGVRMYDPLTRQPLPVLPVPHRAAVLARVAATLGIAEPYLG